MLRIWEGNSSLSESFLPCTFSTRPGFPDVPLCHVSAPWQGRRFDFHSCPVGSSDKLQSIAHCRDRSGRSNWAQQMEREGSSKGGVWAEAALGRGNGSTVDVLGAQHCSAGSTRGGGGGWGEKVDGDREKRKKLKEKELVNKRLLFTFPPPMCNGR